MAEKIDFGPRIGADPELFVIARGKDKSDKNKIVPVCGLVGGTKENPIPVSSDLLTGKYVYMRDYTKVSGFAYQEDNVMFEFNIPPSDNYEIFGNYVQGYLNYLELELLRPRGLYFSWNNRHKFPEKLLQNPMAQTIGCSPDYCAYLPKENNQRQPFEIRQLGNQRFCGGHLHVQYNHNNVPREVFAKFMDLVVSLPYLKLDQQGERRKYYGKAGVFRPKEYGIEYRTPSNFWLAPRNRDAAVHARIASNVLALARSANDTPEELATIYSNKIPWPDVEAAINNEDLKLADNVTRYVAGHLPFGLFMADGDRSKGRKSRSSVPEYQLR